jgi:hypothetical protein
MKSHIGRASNLVHQHEFVRVHQGGPQRQAHPEGRVQRLQAGAVHAVKRPTAPHQKRVGRWSLAEQAGGPRCLHRSCVLRGEVDTGCQVGSWGLLQRLARRMIVVDNNGRTGVYPSGVTASTTPYRDMHTPRHTEGLWSRGTYSRAPFTIVTP